MNGPMNLKISKLPHLWLIDLDGTVFQHNGYKAGHDVILHNVAEFWQTIPKNDVIIIITARNELLRKLTTDALESYGLRYNHIIFDAPTGERILINDIKPGGLHTAVAINVQRDTGPVGIDIVIDEEL